MKILWASNAPWAPSGYGQTTARFVPRIRDLGHDVAMYSNYGLMGAPATFEGMTVYPAGPSDPWGNDVITAYTLNHLQHDRDAGWLIFLCDVWVMRAPSLKTLHVAAWTPVDHTPAPSGVVEFFVRTGAVPLTMSKHGDQMLRERDLNPIYVPHGVDTNIFRPIEQGKELRELLHIPTDAFVVGMVAANKGIPSRKSFPEVFLAFKRFRDKHPSALLYLHTMKNKMNLGMDLVALQRACEIPDEAIFWVDQFAFTNGDFTTVDMVGVYAMMDVLVNPSYGEGFGMPILEAQSCGVPVILADNTAMTELCGAGWLVECEPEWDPYQLSWWGRPTVDGIYQAMEKAYRAPGRLRKQAREFALGYDADDITERYWKPALEELEGMLSVPTAAPVDLEALPA